MSHKFPRVDESSIVFEEFIKVQKDKVTLPNDTQYEHFSIITKETAVAVCAQDIYGNWILVEEYRHPTKQYILGLPGGYLEIGENPILGGFRELFEETGYHSDESALLGSAYPYAGVSGQKTFYLYVKNAVKKNNPTPEPTELMRTTLKTSREIEQLIKSGYPIDANLCTALFLYKLKIGC